jgi:hypothetical protein
LQTGRDPQIVYIFKGLADPVGDYVPGDSSLFVADARVTLGCNDWEVNLKPTTINKYERNIPAYSTESRQIEVKPETIYYLSVQWQGHEFTAQTRTPVAPAFFPVDSLVILRVDENGSSEEYDLKWESASFDNILSLDYPHIPYLPLRPDIRYPERGHDTFQTKGFHYPIWTFRWDSCGTTIAVIHTWNEDFEKYKNYIEESADVEFPVRRFSNIEGTHGVFAAMSNDSLIFRYRKHLQ